MLYRWAHEDSTVSDIFYESSNDTRPAYCWDKQRRERHIWKPNPMKGIETVGAQSPQERYIYCKQVRWLSGIILQGWIQSMIKNLRRNVLSIGGMVFSNIFSNAKRKQK